MAPGASIRYASLPGLPSRHSRAITIVPVLIGIGLAFLTGRTLLIGVGAVWFLAVIAAQTGAEMFLSVRHKLPRRKRDALVEFLSTGGYSLAAASMAAYFVFAFWTSYRPRWLMRLMFVGHCDVFLLRIRVQEAVSQENAQGRRKLRSLKMPKIVKTPS
jgi:hypothetical protein